MANFREFLEKNTILPCSSQQARDLVIRVPLVETDLHNPWWKLANYPFNTPTINEGTRFLHPHKKNYYIFIVAFSSIYHKLPTGLINFYSLHMTWPGKVHCIYFHIQNVAFLPAEDLIRWIEIETVEKKTIVMPAENITWKAMFVHPSKTTARCYTFNPSLNVELIQKITVVGTKAYNLLVYLHGKNQVFWW